MGNDAHGRAGLACVPPIGEDAGGGFVESAPASIRSKGRPAVRIGDALILQDEASGTLFRGCGLLGARLRASGAGCIRFADDVQTPRSFGEKPDTDERQIRDALHLVAAPC